MSDLIDRDDLYHDMTMKRLELHEKGLSWNEFCRGFGFAMEFVKQAPTVEPKRKKGEFKTVAYREIALKLLKEYIDSEQTVIGEYSGDFKKSAEILKDRAMKYLKAFGYDEKKFAELVADTWLFDEADDEDAR